MAEFVKVAKEYARMCNAYPYSCTDGTDVCPINKVKDRTHICRYWTLCIDPEKAEKVILDWTKKNPVKTNRAKFEEVFRFDPYTVDLFGTAWFEKEYEESKDE